ncbi:hypothetical protein CNEO3_130060 [Clostridium neonatale]|nr:hypothetical protein CNEO3_130060 [Clostridium neonatale]CAI3557244.1 hypothetical protein CNEO4_110104 [Clostridium neonatale]
MEKLRGCELDHCFFIVKEIIIFKYNFRVMKLDVVSLITFFMYRKIEI